MEYGEFLAGKGAATADAGIKVEELNPMLFDFQEDITRWALRRGRAAIFASCGLGKTPMQLDWANQIHLDSGKRILIVAPLAVSMQTVQEGVKFGVDVTISKDGGNLSPGITITNYERLHHFSPDDFGGIVLDESSILKGFDGKFRKMVTGFARSIPYRLGCTATPAPNDLMELANHSEFLEILTGKQILAMFFRQDGNSVHSWRLKGHAEESFWRWMGTWSVALREPADLGYENRGFNLPPIKFHDWTIKSGPVPGFLFVMEARTLADQRAARRASMPERVECATRIANNCTDPCLVWCDLNAESEALTKAIPDAVQVQGSDSMEHKENALLGFSRGEIRVLVTKPAIAGFGMNWQHCAQMVFVGVSHSYERFYQAIRRCWRFGQTRPVDVHVITAEAEGAVVANIKRKEKAADKMMAEIVKHMDVYSDVSKHRKRNGIVYEPEVKMELPTWLKTGGINGRGH